MADTPSSVERLRAAMAVLPGAPFYRFETGFDGLERWQSEEGLLPDADLHQVFGLDVPAFHVIHGLDSETALLCPAYEEARLEDHEDYELVRDTAGRVLMNHRQPGGCLPEYVDFPVRSRRTWEDEVRWRLEPGAPGRHELIDLSLREARAARERGMLMRLDVIGGYAFLRNLVGANRLPYLVYDEPGLVREMMDAWRALAEAVLTRVLEMGFLDELVLREDVCHSRGPQLSPEMIREFLLPHYEALFGRVRAGQPPLTRVRLDSDGDVRTVLPLYESVGVNALGPLEASAGCDPIAIGEAHPDWVLWGGIDRRLLTCSTEMMDAELERILPAMKARGGCVPHIDHRVPASVPLANYLHYRRRCVELGS